MLQAGPQAPQGRPCKPRTTRQKGGPSAAQRPALSLRTRAQGWVSVFLPTGTRSRADITRACFNPSTSLVLQEDDGGYGGDRGRGAAAHKLRKVRRALDMKDSMPSLH